MYLNTIRWLPLGLAIIIFVAKILCQVPCYQQGSVGPTLCHTPPHPEVHSEIISDQLIITLVLVCLASATLFYEDLENIDVSLIFLFFIFCYCGSMDIISSNSVPV